MMRTIEEIGQEETKKVRQGVTRPVTDSFTYFIKKKNSKAHQSRKRPGKDEKEKSLRRGFKNHLCNSLLFLIYLTMSYVIFYLILYITKYYINYIYYI